MAERKKRLRESLFCGVPPFHVFIPPDQSYQDPPCQGLQEEEWQFPAQIMPIVRDIVAHAGFKITKGMLRSAEENEIITSGNIWDNLPLVEKTIDAIDFSRLKQAVKINKFPAFMDLNRKDLLWKNFRRMQLLYGKEAFGFHPDTFYLPAEQKQLIERMKRENYEKVYIVKLPNNFCGIGACVVKHHNKIPRKKKVHQEKNKKVMKEDPIIVQKYLSNPYLINGYKFDFRIYVLITSVAPLRIYLYKDGLVRFATEKFSLDDDALENTFIHLTNFTVNKKGETVHDFPPGCQVNKWTIYELWEYMKERGKDPSIFWEEVKDVVIKTVLCAHEKIAKVVSEKSSSFYNNYNLLGLDIFIDTDMKPYLLEVNTIPSLFINNISKEIDMRLKAPIVSEVLNICGHHISSGVGVKHKQDIASQHLPASSSQSIGFDHRLYVKTLNAEETVKQACFLNKYFKQEGREAPNELNLAEQPLYKDSQRANGAINETHTLHKSEKGATEIQEDDCTNKFSENGEDESSEKLRNGKEHSADNLDSNVSLNTKEAEPSTNGSLNNLENGCLEIVNGHSDRSANLSPNIEENGLTGFPSAVKNIGSTDILDNLTPCDVRVLINAEDELTQTETFERIFPTVNSAHYLGYMHSPSYYDLLLDAWEHKYCDSPGSGLARLLEESVKGTHLIVPDSDKKVKVPFKLNEAPKKSYNVPHIFRDK